MVLTGPPLPGRWSLARALVERSGARRFAVDVGDIPVGDIERALVGSACVLVDGDLATARERRQVLEVSHGSERLLIEWRSGRAEAEREIFHRYASRALALAQVEMQRYLDDVARREPVGAEDADSDVTVVYVGPWLTLDQQVERVLAALSAPLSPSPRRPGARRVLVVEDDATERALLADVLGELGFAVELAPEAGVALALLDEGAEIEVLISDQRMPGMSGVELTHEVRQRHPEVRTVLLTAYGDDDVYREALRAQAVTVLSKPLRVIDLERVLDEA
jgi:CheY-like chemotaxis protein